MKRDMKIGTGVTAQDRREWYEAYSEGVVQYQNQQKRLRHYIGAVCRRVFRREADKARHKCLSERAKPVDEQRGSVKCDACGRWFRSRGGLAVHRCSPKEERSAAQGVECRACGRSFRRPGDLKRHKCRVEREKPVEKQKGSVQCGRCKRWMRSKGGLAVHKCRPEPCNAME